MKKFLSILIAIMCITACAFSFTPCGDNTGDNTHTTHNWSATYTQDGDRHYQTCDGCTEKNYSNHDYGTSGTCVCGKQKPEETVAVTGVTLNKNTLALEVNGTETLTATVTPDNATDKSVSWESDKTNIATVDNSGKVTAVAEGTAIITVKTANNKTAQCTVTVSAAVISVTGVTLDKTELTLEVDGTETLTATVAPDNATDKTVTYSVEPAGVVTVDEDGKVTAVAAGTAVITATAANNKTATCEVTVNAPLTNAEVLAYLNDNVLMKAAKHFADNNFFTFDANNVSKATWYITKDGNNIASANLVFEYIENARFMHIGLYNIVFSSPITPQNIKSNELGTPSYTKIYSNAYDRTIQTQHADLTNAICDKLFGEKQNTTRYIIDNGSNSLDPQLGNTSRFTVIEITDTYIKENNIKIVSASTDDGLIANLNDTTKYYTYSEEKNVAIAGTKLENNALPFFGNAD